MAYLDFNATTPLLREALDAMQPFMLQHWGNASSPYAFADEARKAVAQSRAKVAALIGAKPSEIVFTSGATESNQTILWSFLGQGHTVTSSSVEHSSVLSVLEKPKYASLGAVMPVSANGTIDTHVLRRHLASACGGLVSVIWVNNETGIISPVDELAECSHAAGAFLHLDAVQAVGKLEVDVRSVRADYMSLSAHKIHGPKGIGALYIRDGAPFDPFLRGSQESGRRGGTEAVPLIVGFGVAAEIAQGDLARRQSVTRHLRDLFEAQIPRAFPDATINGRDVPRVTNTSSVTFPGIDAEMAVNLLSQRGVYVSSGSACKASSPTPSHVLLAMGRSYEDAGATLRFSFSALNSEEDVAMALTALGEVIPLLRGMA